jgi:hypothetical protein
MSSVAGFNNHTARVPGDLIFTELRNIWIGACYGIEYTKYHVKSMLNPQPIPQRWIL